MTKEESEAIITLSHYPEADVLKKVQAEELEKLANNILSRNHTTPQRLIDYEAGLYQGKKLFSFLGMKEQAKKVGK